VDATSEAGVVSSSAQRVVVFGTGRLLDVPDVSNTDVQSVYALRDSASTVTAWRSSATMVEQTLSPIPDSATPSWTITRNPVDLSTKSGWFLDFDQNAGERVNLDPKIVSGTLNVVTNLPTSSSSCSVGGTSNVYALNVCTGSYIASNSQGNGSDGGSGDTGVDAPVAGSVLSNSSAAVGYIIVRLPSGALKMITTLADGSNVTSGVAAANAVPGHKVGWRRVRN
jgi:type IV pilus assembly protein PilY1